MKPDDKEESLERKKKKLKNQGKIDDEKNGEKVW